MTVELEFAIPMAAWDAVGVAVPADVTVEGELEVAAVDEFTVVGM